jgi:hypothetical protein
MEGGQRRNRELRRLGQRILQPLRREGLEEKLVDLEDELQSAQLGCQD